METNRTYYLINDKQQRSVGPYNSYYEAWNLFLGFGYSAEKRMILEREGWYVKVEVDGAPSWASASEDAILPRVPDGRAKAHEVASSHPLPRTMPRSLDDLADEQIRGK